MKKNMNLADKLRTLRTVHGYTQDYVASILGVVRQTYSHYETGKRNPDAETLYKLAGLYEISTDDLMQLTINADLSQYYEVPRETTSSIALKEYLDYFSNPKNKKKYQYNSNAEKEMLYYFGKISDADKKEMIEFLKIKANKTNSQNHR